jgi:hypothetical protein
MSHKFTVGQVVIFTPDKGELISSFTTRATVTRLLPKQGAEYQYHIQVEPDGLQRRVWENQLQPA